jgi:hypothetical protein
MMRSGSVVAGVVLAALCAMVAPSARADVVIYDNTATFSGSAYSQTGAAMGGGSNIGSMVADDITVGAGGAGKAVDGLTFSSVNFNQVGVSAVPVVQIWSDGTNGPGTLLTTITFSPIPLTAGANGGGAVQLWNFDPGASNTLFTVPANGSFWAGITWTDGGGTTGITAAQLNNVGQALFNPPDVGSSQDLFFQTTTAGVPSGGAIPGSNPTGSLFFFGGSPVANFGWQFLTPTPAVVPEPSFMVLSAVGGLGLFGLGFAKRQIGRRAKAA